MLERNCYTVLQYQTEAKKKLELCEKKLLEVIAKSLGITRPAPVVEAKEAVFVEENAPRASISEAKKPQSPTGKPTEAPSTQAKPPIPPSKEDLSSKVYEKVDVSRAEKVTAEDHMPVQDPWLVRMDSYHPTVYTSRSILANLNADLDLFS